MTETDREIISDALDYYERKMREQYDREPKTRSRKPNPFHAHLAALLARIEQAKSNAS